MVQIRGLTESRLDEIASEIGASFYDYAYDANEGGLKTFFSASRYIAGNYQR